MTCRPSLDSLAFAVLCWGIQASWESGVTDLLEESQVRNLFVFFFWICRDSKLLGLNRGLHRGRVKLYPGAGTGTCPLCHLLWSIRHIWGKAGKGAQAGEYKKKQSCKEQSKSLEINKNVR